MEKLKYKIFPKSTPYLIDWLIKDLLLNKMYTSSFKDLTENVPYLILCNGVSYKLCAMRRRSSLGTFSVYSNGLVHVYCSFIMVNCSHLFHFSPWFLITILFTSERNIFLRCTLRLYSAPLKSIYTDITYTPPQIGINSFLMFEEFCNLV